MQIGLFAQSDVFQHIEKADIESILKESDSLIDLCLLEDQNIYSKSEAKTVLHEFFSANSPVSCKEVHSGSSKKAGAAYHLGKLSVASGNEYRVFIYTNENDKIIEMRIDNW